MSAATLADQYRAGAHLRELATAHGVSHETIRQRLLKAGVKLRPRAPSGGGRHRKRGPLSAEVAADLHQWPSGATVSDLVEWFGESKTALIDAIGPLLADGEVKIVLVGPTQ